MYKYDTFVMGHSTKGSTGRMGRYLEKRLNIVLVLFGVSYLLSCLSVTIICILLFLDGQCVFWRSRFLPLALPENLSLVQDFLRPVFHFRKTQSRRNPREFGEVKRTVESALVLHHLQYQLHFVDIMHELALQRFTVLVLLPYLSNVLSCQSSVHFSKQVIADVVHSRCFSPILLHFRHAVHRCEISHKRLCHVVYKRHFGAARYVDFGGE